MLRILVLSASGLQAITAALLLRSGPHAAANALIIIVAALIGLISQHPRYASPSTRMTAIALGVLAAAIAGLGALRAAGTSMWTGHVLGATFVCLVVIVAASTVSVACLALQGRRVSPRA